MVPPGFEDDVTSGGWAVHLPKVPKECQSATGSCGWLHSNFLGGFSDIQVPGPCLRGSDNHPVVGFLG